MKKHFYIILIILFSFYYLPAQGEETVAGELSIWVENNPQNNLVSMTLELVSPACWNENHYITELFNGGTVGDYINNGWLEFLCCWETYPNEYYRTFGLGLYKITAKVNGVEKAHFFIDYRTSDLPGAITGSCQIDYALDFNVGAGKFYYTNTQNEFSGYHAFWDLRPCVELTTNGLEDYWDNCLAVFNNGDDHPKFAWGPYPVNLGIYEYRIYRNYSGWELLATVDEDEFTFVDEVFINPPGGQAGTDVYYYIKGAYIENPPNPIETPASNTVVVNVPGKDIDKKSASNTNVVNNEYYLSQNYPNPFNPSTIISYSLPVSGQVTLSVFDVLGREIATLINEQKEAGTHNVVFDASNLAGGVYYYKIQSGNYTETRKLILLK